MVLPRHLYGHVTPMIKLGLYEHSGWFESSNPACQLNSPVHRFTDEQFLLTRLADASIDIYCMAAVLTRFGLILPHGSSLLPYL